MKKEYIRKNIIKKWENYYLLDIKKEKDLKNFMKIIYYNWEKK